MESDSIKYNLVVRPFTIEQDYGMIQEWWEKYNSFAPQEHHLGKNGKVIEIDGKPICAGFLFNTDSSICIFEFTVSNPEAEKEEREIALNRLISEAKEWAKMNEYKLLYTPINNINVKFKKRLKSAEFIEVDNNMSHHFCVIGE